MKYTRDKLIDSFNRKERIKYLFFWGHKPSADGSMTKSCFSQWWDCKFSVEGVEYHTAEQYMMAQKAILFSDTEIRDKIMNASHPKQYKDLGRKIRGFDQDIWNDSCCGIVIKGNMAKFSQNEELMAFLLNTNNRVLVEASPYDRIWGIGLSADDRKCENPCLWNGSNLLGFCLMEVRDMLIEKAGA